MNEATIAILGDDAITTTCDAGNDETHDAGTATMVLVPQFDGTVTIVGTKTNEWFGTETKLLDGID